VPLVLGQLRIRPAAVSVECILHAGDERFWCIHVYFTIFLAFEAYVGRGAFSR
jgi:hypothetical protein